MLLCGVVSRVQAEWTWSKVKESKVARAGQGILSNGGIAVLASAVTIALLRSIDVGINQAIPTHAITVASCWASLIAQGGWNMYTNSFFNKSDKKRTIFEILNSRPTTFLSNGGVTSVALWMFLMLLEYKEDPTDFTLLFGGGVVLVSQPVYNIGLYSIKAYMQESEPDTEVDLEQGDVPISTIPSPSTATPLPPE